MFFEFGAEVEPTFNGYVREAPLDEFWIAPLSVEGNHAAIRACFNEFTVTILIERKDRIGQDLATTRSALPSEVF